ncbi:MAG: hypothetical protein PG981_001304 [Wolbachia endosymbiont of Ctenocephalides orientis wCori]|nr:MAG: hypothetical protein PG981_001304 [Wolbachia endosymbiont of Ctenocephalides orientis wCori]
MEEVKQEIKSMPSKIMEDIKKVLSPLKIWGAPTMEDTDYDYVQQYSNEFIL